MKKKLLDIIRELAARAETSGQEEETAKFVHKTLQTWHPDKTITHLGGHGVMAIWSGIDEGPSILVRAELDALPINASAAAHKCGHDGHMAILLGLAEHVQSRGLRRGQVALLFQPAEETGQGAAAVIADERFADLSFDFAYALHNLPGFELGTIVTKENAFASASEGLRIVLRGTSAHAAEPHQGNSPAAAVATLIHEFNGLVQHHTALHEAAQCTVIHASVGQETYGTSPQDAVVCATLRSHDDEVMTALKRTAQQRANAIATCHRLTQKITWLEPFPATMNHPGAVGKIHSAAQRAGLPITVPTKPFPWSEDFGHFTKRFPGALLGLGAGKETPALHHPDYVFPVDLLEAGIRFWLSLLEEFGLI